MRTFKGVRLAEGVSVTVDGAPLNAAELLPDFAGVSFDWGNSGTPAGFLAMALLLGATSSEHLAKEFHEEYRLLVVAALPNRSWEIDELDVWKFIIDRCKERLNRARRRRMEALIV